MLRLLRRTARRLRRVPDHGTVIAAVVAESHPTPEGPLIRVRVVDTTARPVRTLAVSAWRPAGGYSGEFWQASDFDLLATPEEMASRDGPVSAWLVVADWFSEGLAFVSDDSPG